MNKGVKYEPIINTTVSSPKEITTFANPETGENENFAFHILLLNLICFDTIHCSVKIPLSPCLLSPTPYLFPDFLQALDKPNHLPYLSEDLWNLFDNKTEEKL